MHIDSHALPTFAALNTAHWPVEQQNQFANAVDGIMGAEWFQVLGGEHLEREQIATAFAFAAFSHLRSRLSLAPDEELMRDSLGRRPSTASKG